MSFTVVQSGTTFQLVDTAGKLVNLTLPTGITVQASIPPRFVVFGRYVIVVNSPSRPITIDGDGVVRLLSPLPPATPLGLTATGVGTLSGTYKARQTFRILDKFGNVIAESDYGPIMAAGTVAASNFLQATGLALSQDAITDSRIYRTTTLGNVYFSWLTVDGNTQTSSILDDTSDAGLPVIAGPALGTAPGLTLIAEWRGRLWGVGWASIDHLRYTETGMMYSWPILNDLLVPREGSDFRGVTALIARREVLGVGRRNILWQVTGSTASDFRMVKVSENVGIESQETAKVYRDVAYFLWKDGVYQWDNAGVKSVSDGKVRSWFTTDSYFNRGQFSNAFAIVDPLRNRYMLFLASAGQTTIDRWVEYDLEDKTWWGPHKTGAFAPVSSLVMFDANDTPVPVIGSASGFLWQNQATRTDDVSVSIDFDVDGKFHDGNTPAIFKHFGKLIISSRPQPAGKLIITPRVGQNVAAPVRPSMTHDLTTGHEHLQRIGDGHLAQLNFKQNTPGVDVELFGYECEYFERGER